ncbi:MAG: heavy metal translocating P-type ATPase, partial [Leptospiraceae bacterium]|nr:heavy metal translocating P-type ATPase [Leptospiraceae bacterium]
MQEDCFHCQNPVPEKERVLASINGKEEVFCCHGCKTVAELLIDTGKADFYKLRGSSNLEPVQLKDFYTEESLNSEFTYTEYVSGSDETNREVFVNITNIHCSACVWLNEKVLIETEGIKKVRINFASSRAHIVWDDSKLKLYDIFYKIQSIGYKPLLYSPHKKGNANTVQSRDLFLRMAIAGFSFGNIMLFSTSLYAGYFSGIEMEFKKLLHYISWIFATPAFFYSGIPFLRGAFYGLKNRSLNMDSLLAFGVSLAYFYSAYATVTQKGEVYFDSVCMIYFFILLGKYLEALARNKAAEKIQLLLSKLPETVKVLKDGEEKEILSREVKEKDILFIAPGERVAVDGILLDGEAFMDESFMTGESRPVHKKKGDKLLSGSICLNRAITLEASSSYANSSLSHLQTLIETAMLEKPSIQRITDRLASKFITIVFLIAIITFVAWLFYTGNFEKAMVTTVSVLIVACPCALGLSVPISLVMSHQNKKKKGIILK